MFAGATFIPWPSEPSSPGPDESTFTKESGVCRGKSIILARQLSLREEITIRVGTGNSNSWTEAFLLLEVGGVFHGRCNAWGDHLGLRHLTVTLYAEDDTTPFTADDVWLSAQFAQQVIAGDIARMDKDSPNRVESDRRKLLSSFDLEWTPSRMNSVNISFPLVITDVRAEPHVGDLLRFTAVLVMTIGETICAARCWSPSAEQSTETVPVETTIKGEPWWT